MAFCDGATSHKLLIMTNVTRRRDCYLTSLPNILEKSGLRTANSKELPEVEGKR